MQSQIPDVSILKYNAGNIMSVIFSLQRLGASFEITDDIERLKLAKRIIFPGVGEAGSAMQSLRDSGLDSLIPTLKQPFLGTCVGMQLLCTHSEESDTACLGVFDVLVKKFPKKEGFKVPHTGWNTISYKNKEFDIQHPLLKNIKQNEYMYYNHGYYAEFSDSNIAITDHILPFSAILQKDNFYACQFHAEISGKAGSTLFKNFLEL
jgi:imidazole glycerol-phosphate synthase subunit HisH